MNPSINQTTNFIKRKVIAFLTVLAAAACLTPAVFAQDQQLQVVSQQSSASLFLGSQHDPTSLNVGVANISGNFDLDPDNVSASTFNFIVYPSLSNLDGVVAYGEFDVDRAAALNDEPMVTFHSTSAVLRSDGKLAMAGELTLVSPEYTVSAAPGMAYSGQVLRDPKLVKVSQPATFVLDDPNLSASQGAGTFQLVGSLTVNGEAFPEVYNAVAQTPWPAIVRDEHCQTTLSVGEDYSGPKCTGTLIEAASPRIMPTSTGEDFAGVNIMPPDGDQVTIQLHGELASANSSTSTRARSGITAADATPKGNLH